MIRFASLVAVCASVTASACVVVSKEPPPAAPPPPAATPAQPAPVKPNRDSVAQPTATGKPPNLAGGEGGVWIWRDARSWHLRTTTQGKQHMFSGTVTGKGKPITGVQSARVETGDKIRSADGKVDFDLTTTGQADGFDFSVEGNACVNFDLTIDGTQAPHRIMVGQAEQHPQAARFTACP